MQRVHKTRFPPNRDTFIVYTFSAAEGIAPAVNDPPRRGGEKARKSVKNGREVKGWRRAMRMGNTATS